MLARCLLGKKPQLQIVLKARFVVYNFKINSCVSCGTRTMHNRVIAHLREKYENEGNQVNIISKTADSFDQSYEVFLQLDDKPFQQVWSKLGGDDNITAENFKLFDEKIALLK